MTCLAVKGWQNVLITRDASDWEFWSWHIASFHCAAEFGRYRGIADIEQTTAIKLDL